MTFLYPLGLLGLIGIPILILIYIIKSKYTEQTVASTYLWLLSEKFLKRKNPLSNITGLISLILQILAITFVSLAIAHPMFIVPNSANEYCFVLDGSGSMNMMQDGKSRFDLAKEEIATVIKDSVNKSRYSLVYAGDEAVVVFEQIDNKDQALLLLDEVEPNYGEGSIGNAMSIAQGYFNERPDILTYLVTDTAHQVNENIHLVNVASDIRNCSVSNVNYKITDTGLIVSGDVFCYKGSKNLSVSLYVDGAQEAAASTRVVAKDGAPAHFQLNCEVSSFSSLKIAASAEDATSLDDELVIYDVKSESSYKTLLVSERPFFMRSVLNAIGLNSVQVVAPKEYFNMSGFGLYIFESFTPAEMPKDGAVWLINPTASSSDTGFSVQGEVTLERPDVLSLTTSTSSVAKQLSEGLTEDEIYITSYVKCGLYRNFTSVYSYKGNPVIFAGTNDYGNREVVFAFDLHKSNIPLLYDFVLMANNFLDYSFPTVVEEVNYYVGETARVNVLSSCDSIRVDSPMGRVTYLDTATAACDLRMDEVGTYTITLVLGNNQRVFNIYSSLPEQERNPDADGLGITLQGQAVEGGFDGEYDPLPIIFIVLALVFILDWGVYCYEKYQLR